MAPNWVVWPTQCVLADIIEPKTVFLKCKIANLAQNGTKLGRVGRPQCVGPKILGRGWTHQLPQASLERNLDICGPFFDVWFTKVET